MAKRILVVCDDPPMVYFVQQILEEKSFTVAITRTGLEGLEMIASTRPDLVILDVDMTFIENHETHQRIRNNPATCDLPIIALTVQYTGDRIGPEFVYTPDIYLTKPFNAKQLQTFVLRMLEEAEDEREARKTPQT
jgi:CheY-like chemotaxis protein